MGGTVKALWIVSLLVLPSSMQIAAGQTLDETLKFLQEKIPGKVNYIVYGENGLTGASNGLKRTLQLGSVYADMDQCSITFHMHFDNGKGGAPNDKDVEIAFKRVTGVSLGTMAQTVQLANAKAGHPEVSVRVDPPIFLVVLKYEPDHSMMFNFYDEALSERVARALQHAAELCGGGRQDPF